MSSNADAETPCSRSLDLAQQLLANLQQEYQLVISARDTTKKYVKDINNFNGC